MKPCTFKIILSLIVLGIVTSPARAAYYSPRASIWGLSGTENQGRIDALFPVAQNADHLFYTDLQGGVGKDNAWYGGLGAGYRQLINNSAIYGGYLFIDRNESYQHNQYWVLSPGVEAISVIGDLRLNGYIPVNKRHNSTAYFPSTRGDCRFVEFQGHSQFEHQFLSNEEVGPGVDTEVGYNFPRLHNTQFHTGAYYFILNNSKNIQGVEARLEVPLNYNWAIDLESSYDNYQHGAVVAGLRFNLGRSAAKSSLQTHMIDPVSRNLGSLNSGSGIPIITHDKEDSLVLQRSNIFFFTSQGGTPFVNNVESGTFENPLRNDQFSQSVVDQIGNNANLYFNSGNYIITGVGIPPNAQINLPYGDSMYGRSLSFRCPASGDDRPLILGRINLLQGNNTIDSIRLLNSVTDISGAGSNVIALNIQNAAGVRINNSDILAIATVTGDLLGNNFASGIYARNSQVLMNNSLVSATARVLGNNTGGANFATGIGGNSEGDNVSSNNNVFVLNRSSVNGLASINGNNDENSLNFATGIGGNVTFNGTGSAGFSSNNFIINFSQVNGSALVGGNNNLANSLATGIGTNNTGTTAGDFIANSFILNSSTISGIASLGGVNTNSSIMAAGIGSNCISAGSGNFISNTIKLTKCNITGTTSVGTADSGSTIFATGIGGNNIGPTADDFINNDIALINSQLTASTTIVNNNAGLNLATGIGGNTGGGTANFSNNIINIEDSNINATAIVGGINTVLNRSIGINMNAMGNNVTINRSTISVLAQTRGNNDPAADNTAIGINVEGGGGNQINIDRSIVGITAQIIGSNSGINTALGLVNNGVPLSDIINISNSFVTVIAQSDGVNIAEGTSGTGTINIVNTLFSITPPPPLIMKNLGKPFFYRNSWDS